MAKPSAYQRQATGRAARATKQVVLAEGRVRAAARVLADALATADKAAAGIEAVNKTYGTGYPSKSKYVQVLGETGISEAISKAAEAAPTPEHQAIIGTFEDSKDGAELPGLAVLGEYEAPTPVKENKPRRAKEPEVEPAKE
jgi:hypothetical protein